MTWLKQLLRKYLQNRNKIALSFICNLLLVRKKCWPKDRRTKLSISFTISQILAILSSLFTSCWIKAYSFMKLLLRNLSNACLIFHFSNKRYILLVFCQYLFMIYFLTDGRRCCLLWLSYSTKLTAAIMIMNTFLLFFPTLLFSRVPFFSFSLFY